MNNEDRNHVSVLSWMILLFLSALPIIGVITVLVGAFAGSNDSRKNYFRAILAWIGVCITFVIVIMLLGHWPEVQKQIQSWLHKA